MESGNTKISNPILRGMYPDPSWMWDDARDAVILVNSSFELVPGLPLHASEDLAQWTPIGYAVDDGMARKLLLEYVEDSGGLYAPTLRRIGDGYAIACTVARLNEDKAREAGVPEDVLTAFRESEGNFVITAASLEGPWSGPFWIRGAEGIDPDVFEDVNGDVFWTQTRPSVNPRWEGQTQVWIQRVDTKSWELMPSHDERGQYGKTVIWDGYGVEAVWAEGPHLYRMGDEIYLMTAEGGTSFDHSEMMMRTTASEGLGAALAAYMREHDASVVSVDGRPEERSVVGWGSSLFHPDKKNPFLTHRHLGVECRVQCVGHADLMLHPRKGWWLTCLASRQTPVQDGMALNFLGRETWIAPVSWQHDPGNWALVADGQPATDDGTLGWPVLSGGVGRLAPSLYVNKNGRLMGYDLAEEGGMSVMDLTAIDDEIVADQLTQVRGDDSVAYRRLISDNCLIILPKGESVRIRQDNVHYIDIQVSPDGKAFDWVVSRGQSKQVGDYEEDVQPDAMPCALFSGGSLHLGHSTRSAEMTPETSAIDIDARFLSTEWSGGFVGLLIGVVR